MAETLFEKYDRLVCEAEEEIGRYVDLGKFDGIYYSDQDGWNFTSLKNKDWEDFYKEGLENAGLSEDDEEAGTLYEVMRDSYEFTYFDECTEDMFEEAFHNLIEKGPERFYPYYY